MNNRNKPFTTLGIILFSSLLTPLALSATVENIDSNDNGLIDITTLDELNQIRLDLTGSSLAGNTNGCPVDGCFGYELMNDLDFDANANGDLSDDPFWNDGEGWLPIAIEDGTYFSATLEGNGHTIRNLFIDRESELVGLIAKANGATIANLTLAGPLTSITGNKKAGALIAEASNSEIVNTHFSGIVSTNTEQEADQLENTSTGGLVGSLSDSSIRDSSVTNATITGYNKVGGLVGYIYRTKIQNSHSLANVSVSGNDNVGGLIGHAHWSKVNQGDTGIYASSSIAAIQGDKAVGGLIGYGKLTYIHKSYSMSDVSGNERVGGFIGHTENVTIQDAYALGNVLATSKYVGGLIGLSEFSTVTNAFSASKVTAETDEGRSFISVEYGQAGDVFDSYWDTDTAGVESDDSSATPATTIELSCPTTSVDINCNRSTLFENWDATVWDFGTKNQYPALLFNGISTRDTDRDGILDSVDTDDDNDGVKDEDDVFPFDASETVDSDLDGVGDNADAFPNDASETVDTDLDGIGNNTDTDDDNDGVNDDEDAFPFDNTESADTDLDGVGDNTDVFPNDSTEWQDTDQDNVGDNSDAFPFDPSETLDSDLDGVGDNSDALPNDASETLDTDGDGIGNNADTDDDNDSVLDDDDAFPLDPTETIDTDEDGIGNNADTDDDGDNVLDENDFFPLDATGSVESDSVDSNGNGLIEITTLEQLNEIRNNLSEIRRNGKTAGCPNAKCLGFELMNDLDFDTNHDGVMDVNDTYWNEGKGWQPIGDDDNFYSEVFEGNNHTIYNLYINRPNTYYVGLFASIGYGEVRNLTLTGELAAVTGANNVGALTGTIVEQTISNVHNFVNVTGDKHVGGIAGINYSYSGKPSKLSSVSNQGNVSGNEEVGGLVGTATSLTINDSFNRANVSATGNYIGGLAGYFGTAGLIERSYSEGAIQTSGDEKIGGLVGMLSESEINNSYATGSVSGTNLVGGLVGSATSSSFIFSSYANIEVIATQTHGALVGEDEDNSLLVSNSYWNLEKTGANENEIGTGLTSAQMTCPTEPNNDSCASSTVYAQWDSNVWNFGTATDFPTFVSEQQSDKPSNDDQPNTGTSNNADSNSSSGGSLNLWFALLLPLLVIFRKEKLRY